MKKIITLFLMLTSTIVSAQTTVTIDGIKYDLNGTTGFYRVAEAQPTVRAFRAWLNVPASDVKVYTFRDNATSINEELRNKSEEFSIYNVAGQKLSKMQKSINIVGGKKVTIK